MKKQDYIYPGGYISEDLNLEIPKKIDKNYFNFNEKELKEILKLKERIPSTEENP